MQSRTSLVIAVMVGGLCTLMQPLPVPAAGWKAGTARGKITPKHSMPLAGFASRKGKPSEGTLTDLWAKVLVLEDAQGHRAALITLDLLGVDRTLSQSICSALQEQHQWGRDQIAICSSHNHSGPAIKTRLTSVLQESFDSEADRHRWEYINSLKPLLVNLVNEALTRLEPAELFCGNGHSEFAVNRRENKPSEVLTLRAEGRLKGPSDHDVPVLVVRQNGKPTTIVFGYACHNTTLSSMQWSGDYAGFAQLDLEAAYPECQAMFWAGCGGDQDPLPRGSVELAKNYGTQLAEAVEQVVNGPMTPIQERLTTRYQEVDLKLGAQPTREKLEKDAKSDDRYVAGRARSLLSQLDNGQPLRQSYPYPVALWKLGDEVKLVLLGGEPVVDYALRIKEDPLVGKLPTRIWCAGYANDVMAYIPSRRVLLEGGYEGAGSMVYYGLPTVWAPEIEETIVQTVRELSAP
ncbi:neutral/alkaline non-lysosomal ceramidase N-terminal domain-containing protein [Planctomicrobium sp. SH664]|uniref:neutral/alkaline non-lysosomal ceramidase N-terminal domain-containing protein n=1 Tax=Planctomicrobium sp. SH664 TaxID=3448125 RepID=UPI003F5AE05D